MHVREARNNEEVWLLDHIEEKALDELSFRSRDYLIAVDEEADQRVAFGRNRIHRQSNRELCEITSVGVLDEWAETQAAQYLITELVEDAADQEFNAVYAFPENEDQFTPLGFESINHNDLPPRLQQRYHAKEETLGVPLTSLMLPVDQLDPVTDAEDDEEGEDLTQEEVEELADEMGVNTEQADYKYSTGS